MRETIALFGVVFGTSFVTLTIGILITDIIPRKKFVDSISYRLDNLSFRFKNKDFTIRIETAYSDFHMNINKVYINEELACKTYRLERLFNTIRFVNIENGKSEKELYEIIKYADKVYWDNWVKKFKTENKNHGYSYFE